MKKLFILSIILLSLTLVGCSQNNELTQAELFDKKQECNSHIEKIQKEWEGHDFIDEPVVFYSITKNSCIGVIHRLLDDTEWVYDVLSNEIIFLIQNKIDICEGTEYIKDETECNQTTFKNKIKELKGE